MLPPIPAIRVVALLAVGLLALAACAPTSAPTETDSAVRPHPSDAPATPSDDDTAETGDRDPAATGTTDPATAAPRTVAADAQAVSTASDADAAAAVAAGTDALGRDLLGVLHEPGTTTVVSPTSLAMMLSLLLAGAEGTTADDLAAALGTSTTAPVDGSVGALLVALDGANADDVELAIANAAWIDVTAGLDPGYMTAVAAGMGAVVEELDLRDAAAVAAIDEWADQRTNGLIDSVTPDLGLPGDAVAVVANATYLLADWSTPFDADRTAEGDFTTAAGTTATVELMHADGVAVAVARGDGVLLVRIPYGEDGRLGFEVLLPVDHSLSETLDATDAAAWQALSEAAEPARHAITMPSLDITATHELTSVLGALGLGSVLTGGITGMAAADAVLDAAVQKVVLRVDEQGTEAAAVTAGATRMSAPVVEPIVIDRAFAFTIRDTQTGAALFSGIVDDPTR